MAQSDHTAEMEKVLAERIMVLDGAMGTTIRTYGLDEAAARGERFAKNDKDLLNNGDILSITQPQVISDIHKRFYEAGSDICETNTFSATGIAQSEFFVEDPRETGGRKDPEFSEDFGKQFLNELAWEMNVKKSSQLARKMADDIGTDTGIKRYVAGAIGPLTVSLSNSPDAEDSSFRVVTFDQVLEAYRLQVRGLIEGGCDILMIETIFDSLNAKAAAVAVQDVYEEKGIHLPVIISAAVGLGGETMISAQKVEALWNAFAHVKPLAIGLNCSLGPDLMRPFLEELSEVAETYVSAYPNAGLPNPLAPTGFDLEPPHMKDFMRDFATSGLINFAGGCCGNTPEHVRAIAEGVKGVQRDECPDNFQRKAAKNAEESQRKNMKDYLNKLSNEVIGAAIEVHKELGAGLLESTYEASLQHELDLRGIGSLRQVSLPVTYKGLELPDSYRIDLLVENTLVIEIKAVDNIIPVHSAQLLTYLKMSNNHLGLLINFHTVKLADSIKRIVHQFPNT